MEGIGARCTFQFYFQHWLHLLWKGSSCTARFLRLFQCCEKIGSLGSKDALHIFTAVWTFGAFSSMKREAFMKKKPVKTDIGRLNPMGPANLFSLNLPGPQMTIKFHICPHICKDNSIFRAPHWMAVQCWPQGDETWPQRKALQMFWYGFYRQLNFQT